MRLVAAIRGSSRVCACVHARPSRDTVAQSASAVIICNPCGTCGIHSLLENPGACCALPEFVFDPLDSTFFWYSPSIAAMNRLSSAHRTRLSRQHSALDGEVNSLQPGRIQEAAESLESSTHCRRSEESPPSSVRHRFRAVTNHLAAFKQLRDHGCCLKSCSTRADRAADRDSRVR